MKTKISNQVFYLGWRAFWTVFGFLGLFLPTTAISRKKGLINMGHIEYIVNNLGNKIS